MEDKIREITNELHELTGKDYPNEAILAMCVSVVYNGIFKKGWNIKINNE